MNRLLVLEAVERVADGAGGYGETWVERGSLWAEMRPGSGSARVEAGQSLGVVAYRVVVRAAPVGSPARPQAGQRFREGARVFAIAAVAENDPAGRFLSCFVTEEVAA